MLKKLKDRMLNKNKANHAEVAVESRVVDTLREKIENYTEAITFAEAGLQEHARELISAEIQEKVKVLVVGNEDTFSKPVVDYAVGFADRMGYEIVALNVSPVRTESSKLAPFCDMLCEQFKTKAEEGVTGFRQACEQKGIPFSQLIKFGEVDHCIKESHEEIRRVEFVITEPESCPAEGKVAIPVFCLAR
jgi:phosphoribosylaminoimidazole (AIR) synthetase